jgi:hypothetical protein
MKAFLLKIAKEIALLSLIGALFATANILLWKKELNGDYPQLLADKKSVAVGHSRIRYAIDDKALPNFINLSYDGRPHFYSAAIIRNILDNNDSIKTYYINFDNRLYEGMNWVGNTPSGAKNFGRYLPLLSLQDCQTLSSALPYDKQAQILIKKTLPNLSKEYLETLLSYFNLMTNKKKYFENILGNHSTLNGNKLSSVNADDNEKQEEIDQEKINEHSFLALVKLLQEKGKNVVLINTPVYEKRDKELQVLNDFLYRNNLQNTPYLNFQQSLTLADSMYFDKSHLNSKGTAFFSKILQDSVRQQKLLN